MKKHSSNKTTLPVRMIVVISIILSFITAITSSFKYSNNDADADEKNGHIIKDSVKSVKAFMQVYKVLMSPRCMNCHPSGDAPLQGDDNHVHTMNVHRGVDGMGMYALKCSNCHQPTNVAGLHTPPGNPKWHLPPADMKMIFQGRTARQLALQIMDYNQNGHKNKEQLLEHARDTLVKACWQMAENYTKPPLSYSAFVAAWDSWIKTGAYAPRR